MTRAAHLHLVRCKIIVVLWVAGEPLADGVEQIQEEHLLVLRQLHHFDGIFNFLISKVERSSPQKIAPDGPSPSRVVVDQGQGDVVDREQSRMEAKSRKGTSSLMRSGVFQNSFSAPIFVGAQQKNEDISDSEKIVKYTFTFPPTKVLVDDLRLMLYPCLGLALKLERIGYLPAGAMCKI